MTHASIPLFHPKSQNKWHKLPLSYPDLNPFIHKWYAPFHADVADIDQILVMSELNQLRGKLNRQIDLNRAAQAQIKPTLELLCEAQRENGRLTSELERMHADNIRMQQLIDRNGNIGCDRQHPM